MPGSLRVGHVFGIDVRVHFSWLFIFLLVSWSLASSYLPTEYPGWDQSAYWGVGIAGSTLLFLSVLLHEFSHSLVALSRGHRVRGITLFVLGGVSEIEQEATNAGEEFLIAVVGPATSVVLAAIFWGLFWATPSSQPELEALLGYLAFVNLVLAVFNLVPAYPLDGGRVLKALVWRVTGSMARSVTVAGVTGTALGVGLMVLGGVLAVLYGNVVSGLWLVFIGWFIQSSAKASRRHQIARTALQGRTVRDAMEREFPTVGPGVTLQDLVDHHITRDFRESYVVAFGAAFLGLVSASDVRSVPPEERRSRYVTEVMARAAPEVTIGPDAPLDMALERLSSGSADRLVVVDGGRAIGLLTQRDISRIVDVSRLFPR